LRYFLSHDPERLQALPGFFLSKNIQPLRGKTRKTGLVIGVF